MIKTTAFFFLAAGFVGCVGDAPTTSPAGDASTPDTGSGPMDSSSDSATTPDAGCEAGSMSCGGSCTAVGSDPANCGRCAHACGAMAKCTAGACQPFEITSMATGAVALATDETPDNPAGASVHVFWAVQSSSTAGAYQDNVTGGNTIELSTSGNPNDIAVHGANVYWPTYNFGNGQVNILRGNVGTAATQLGVGSPPFSPTMQNGILLDPSGATLYSNYTSNSNFGIYKCKLDMTPCASVISYAGVPGLNLATDGTSMFMADQNGGTIYAVQISTGNSSPVVTGQATPNLLRFDGTHLYWSNSGTKTIWRSDAFGTGPMQIVSTTAAASGLAADAVNVYWTDSSAGTLSYAPIGGGGATTKLVTQGASSSPMRLVRDGQSLYWIHNTSIWRVALP